MCETECSSKTTKVLVFFFYINRYKGFYSENFFLLNLDLHVPGSPRDLREEGSESLTLLGECVRDS